MVESIKPRLEGVDTERREALEIADDLFDLQFKHGLSNDDRVRELVSVFKKNLKDWDLEDLLEREVNYAIRLGDAPGELIYEEMHKLFCLCDDIFALEYLGLLMGKQKKQEYEEAVKGRFRRERKRAKLVAEDKADEWSKEFWWYKQNLDN